MRSNLYILTPRIHQLYDCGVREAVISIKIDFRSNCRIVQRPAARRSSAANSSARDLRGIHSLRNSSREASLFAAGRDSWSNSNTIALKLKQMRREAQHG
jgi:hypothetical protein